MTIWAALHTKYKLGGFLPMVTWVPLNENYNYPMNPVNKDTPMLYFNGYLDLLVPVFPAYTTTKTLLHKIFTDFEADLGVGTHITTHFNPLNIAKFARWICEKTSLQFRTTHPVSIQAKVANGGKCKGGNCLVEVPCFGFFCKITKQLPCLGSLG